MERVVSLCGIVCSDCQAFDVQCAGCDTMSGVPSWMDEVDFSVCPLYACCRDEKRLTDCGRCPQLPCSLYTELKDPSLSDEEHARALRARMDALRSESVS